MLHNAAFHLSLHCLPKYLLNGIKNENHKNMKMTMSYTKNAKSHAPVSPMDSKNSTIKEETVINNTF